MKKKVPTKKKLTVFLKKIWGETFSKKFVRKLFWKFPDISKKFWQETFPEIFRKNCGKLFRQTSRKETIKKSPGTFPKNGGTFRQNPLWKRVFSPQISGGNLGGFLTDPGSFPENPRGNFPGNSRKFRGENPGFFSGFCGVSRLQRRVDPLKNGAFSGDIPGEILGKQENPEKSTTFFPENFSEKNFGENFSEISGNFRKFLHGSGKIRVFYKTRFVEHCTHLKILVIFGHFCHFFDKNRRKFRGKIPRKIPRKIGEISGENFPGFFRNPLCGTGYPGGKSGGKSEENFPEISEISENFRKKRVENGHFWRFSHTFAHGFLEARF